MESNDDVQTLLKAFAKKNGWPRIQPYQTTFAAWEELRKIPGSFAAEETPEGCPISDPMLRAEYDLLPKLLENQRNIGKWLAFGYGRQWYVVEKDPRIAMQQVMIRYPYHMPWLSTVVTPEEIREEHALEYYSWKESQEASVEDALPVPACIV